MTGREDRGAAAENQVSDQDRYGPGRRDGGLRDGRARDRQADDASGSYDPVRDRTVELEHEAKAPVLREAEAHPRDRRGGRQAGAAARCEPRAAREIEIEPWPLGERCYLPHRQVHRRRGDEAEGGARRRRGRAHVSQLGGVAGRPDE
ncbi:MAG: hypothetical protein E6J77_21330 [Deltaproteobacteria bacterium]|nr:MAG: hypothetical protein E6J77_21330 [Deltaproteobacteria bacterium]